jgi:hypothetical protein
MNRAIGFFVSPTTRFLWNKNLDYNPLNPGARQLPGENLEVVRAEFSTLSLEVLVDNNINAQRANGHF